MQYHKGLRKLGMCKHRITWEGGRGEGEREGIKGSEGVLGKEALMRL